MPKFLVGFVVFMAIASSVLPGEPEHPESSGSLCQALIAVGPNEEVPITVSGVYWAGSLYDPEELVCQFNVQPSTCVEFSLAQGRPAAFNNLLAESNRAYVRFRGVLHGPASPAVDGTGWLATLRVIEFNRAKYCDHVFRTKLVVEEILDFGPVPEDVPLGIRYHDDRASQPLPIPVSMSTPLYPWEAQRIGLTGRVVVNVSVSAGSVAVIGVSPGDPLLVDEAVRNIKTWKFESTAQASFSIVFTFALEKRLATEDESVILEMHLPSIVRVLAPMYAW